jgi:hypothetical protein
VGAGAALGVGWAAEGGPESREAAGLVLFKTSPGQTPTSPELHRENSVHTVDFCPHENKRKRLKKLKAQVWISGQLHCLPKPGHRPDVPWFVTLTYAHEGAWRPDHISEAMDRYRAWCTRLGIACRYIWVAELTAAGRVHYHLIAWLPAGKKMTFWDKPRRVKGKNTVAFWTHGMSNTQQAKHGVSYLMKYLSKMGEFHQFPQGLRLYGVGGLNSEHRSMRAWSNLPHWVKCSHGVGEVRRIRGRLVNMATGEMLPPMYRRKFIPGGIELHQLRPYPEKIYDHGAFCSWPRP